MGVQYVRTGHLEFIPRNRSNIWPEWQQNVFFVYIHDFPDSLLAQLAVQLAGLGVLVVTLLAQELWERWEKEVFGHVSWLAR